MNQIKVFISQAVLQYPEMNLSKSEFTASLTHDSMQMMFLRCKYVLKWTASQKTLIWYKHLSLHYRLKMTPSLAVVLANEIRHTLRFLKYPWYMSIIVLWKLQENIAYLNYNFCMFLNLCLKPWMTQKYQINNTKLYFY